MRLIGDCLLSAAFLSYCSAFTHEFRRSLLQDTWLPGVVQQLLPVTTPFRCAACGRRGTCFAERTCHRRVMRMVICSITKCLGKHGKIPFTKVTCNQVTQ